MANQIDTYIHIKYAQEAFSALEKAIGFARTVARGYTKTPNERGKTVQIDVPSAFTAQSMPESSPNDVTTDKIEIVLDQWHGVSFAVRDDELSYASPALIENHIRPAAYAVADKIDQSLADLSKLVPWYVAATATPTGVEDLTALRQQLFDLKVPMRDMERYLAIDGEREAKFLNLPVFHSAEKDARRETQLTGSLGDRLGFGIFATQNVAAHTAGTLTAGTAAQLNAAASKGDTSIVIKDSGGVLSGTVKKGDTLVIAGNTQRYVATADATAAANLVTVNVFPALVQDYDENDAVTLRQVSKQLNVAYHRTAFALGFSPLPEPASGMGAIVRTIQDPLTGLTLRMTVWYDANAMKSKMRIDALWGVKVLDPNRAVRYES